MDLSKDEKHLTPAERDEVERQILEAVESCAKEAAKKGQPLLAQSEIVANNTPYLACAAYRKSTIMEWLEILKEKRMIEHVETSMNGRHWTVKLAGRGLERIRMHEEDYQRRSNPISNQFSNVFHAPVGQFAQSTGSDASIRQSQKNTDRDALLPLVESLLLEIRAHRSISTDATGEAEQLRIEVKKDSPSASRIGDYLDRIKILAGAALPVIQIVEEVRKCIR